MHSDYYEWRTAKGPLTIEKSHQHPWCWDLCLNGMPIQKGYNDPNQAVVDANKSDFGDETKNSILKGIFVHWDIKQWSTWPSQTVEKKHQNN
jgi:hypothetical protein